jgi:hypothetical protein
MEGYFTGDPAVGAVNASLYTSMDSETAVETHTVSGLDTTGQIIIADFGNGNTAADNNSVWLDDVGVSTTGYLGPVVDEGGGSSTGIVAALVASM